MAKRIVEIIYGLPDAERAEKSFETTVQKREVVTDNLTEIEIRPNATLLEFLKSAVGDRYSSGDIKRMIEQGGVEIGGVKTTNLDAKIPSNPEVVIKFGKREFFRPKYHD